MSPGASSPCVSGQHGSPRLAWGDPCLRGGVVVRSRLKRANRGAFGVSRARVAGLAVVAAALMLFPVSSASSTPNPTSVTIAGDLQTAVGCASSFDPTCAATHLAYDASDDVWQGTFSLPAGSYQYKAALNDSWTENYGLHAQAGGANIPLNLAAPASVKFYYDHKTHWVTDNQSSVIATAVGDFQSELGCPGDWQPDCLQSWLEDPDGDGVYTFVTTAHSSRQLPGEGRDRRELERELRRGRRARRREHLVRRPGRPPGDDLHLRLDYARPDGFGREPARARPTGRGRSRTSTWHGRTASAPPRTRPRRSGSPSRTGC